MTGNTDVQGAPGLGRGYETLGRPTSMTHDAIGRLRSLSGHLESYSLTKVYVHGHELEPSDLRTILTALDVPPTIPAEEMRQRLLNGLRRPVALDGDEVVERVARALYEHWCDEQIVECAPWAALGDKESWLDRARAALKAIR